MSLQCHKSDKDRETFEKLSKSVTCQSFPHVPVGLTIDLEFRLGKVKTALRLMYILLIF